MDRDEFTVVICAEHPELRDAMNQVGSEPWPEFMFHDLVSDGLWNRLYEVFPNFQFGLMENRAGRLVAVANSIPLAWHGTSRLLPDDGWDWAIAQGFEDRAQGATPHTLSALQISITRDFQGKGCEILPAALDSNASSHRYGPTSSRNILSSRSTTTLPGHAMTAKCSTPGCVSIANSALLLRDRAHVRCASSETYQSGRNGRGFTSLVPASTLFREPWFRSWWTATLTQASTSNPTSGWCTS